MGRNRRLDGEEHAPRSERQKRQGAQQRRGLPTGRLAGIDVRTSSRRRGSIHDSLPFALKRF